MRGVSGSAVGTYLADAHGANRTLPGEVVSISRAIRPEGISPSGQPALQNKGRSTRQRELREAHERAALLHLDDEGLPGMARRHAPGESHGATLHTRAEADLLDIDERHLAHAGKMVGVGGRARPELVFGASLQTLHGGEERLAVGLERRELHPAPARALLDHDDSAGVPGADASR